MNKNFYFEVKVEIRKVYLTPASDARERISRAAEQSRFDLEATRTANVFKKTLEQNAILDFMTDVAIDDLKTEAGTEHIRSQNHHRGRLLPLTSD